MSALPAARPALSRDPAAGPLGGVCAGIGSRLGIDPLVLRVVVVASSAAGGVGIVLYSLAWILLPVSSSQEPSVRRPAGTATASLQVGLGVSFLLASLLLTLRELGLWAGDPFVFPLVLAAGGIGLVWRQSTEPFAVTALPSSPRAADTLPAADPSRTREQERDEQLLGVYRGGFGIALILGASLLVLQTTGALSGARDLLLSTVVVTVALVLILAPFLFRFGATLTAERSARIRSEERAEVAAHLHDSVLQTLALVQQQSADPRTVATLARRQERELRTWLDGDREPTGRFAGALRAAAADVEEQYAVPVDVVAVGDTPLDDDLRAMVAAAREAIVNAAKFGAGQDGPSVAVYAEITDAHVELFVRDRGPGFDPATVPADRRGVRESIVGRMERRGGTAELHTAPGAGVEVELRLERRP